MRRETFIAIVSILVSLVFLGFILRGVPLVEVGQALRQANIGWVMVSLVFIFLSIATRAIRWRGLLQNRISVRDSLYLMGVTFMLNQLPLRAGEVARSLFVTQRDIPFMTGATSIIVERLLDVLTVVLLIAVSVPFLPDVPPQITQGAIIFGIFGVIGFAILLFFAHLPQAAHSLLNVILKILPFLKRLPLEEWLDHVLEGLQPLTNWGTFFHAIVWTAIAWGTSFVALYTLLLAMNFENHLLLMTALGMGLASLSIAIPLNFAAIGIFEAAIIFAGSLIGLETIKTTALGFLYHGISVLGYIILGVIGILSLGISMSDIFQRDTSTKPD